MTIEFSSIISPTTIDLVGGLSAVMMLFFLAYKLIRWRQMAPSIFDYVIFILYESRRLKFGRNLRIILSVVLDDTATQSSSFERFKDKIVHLSIFWGFIGLAASTTLSFVSNPNVEPLELTHPVRILGNLGGFAIMGGLTIALLRRLFSEKSRTQTAEYDISFFTILYAASASGFLLEYAGMINSVNLTSAFYYVHLGIVGSLVLAAPFSKFLHAIKLPLLILFYRYRRALLEENILVPTMPIGLINQELLNARWCRDYPSRRHSSWSHRGLG